VKDSVTYQAILEEGEAKGIREVLLCVGRRRFALPDPAAEMALSGVTDLERLRRMSDCLLNVNSWQELPETP
jgi:hypothetical protein